MHVPSAAPGAQPEVLPPTPWATMAQWKGDWGFDPEIAAQVTNAMPPWLIAQEANTLDPFRAADNASASSTNCAGKPASIVRNGDHSGGERALPLIQHCQWSPQYASTATVNPTGER